MPSKNQEEQNRDSGKVVEIYLAYRKFLPGLDTRIRLWFLVPKRPHVVVKAEYVGVFFHTDQ